MFITPLLTANSGLASLLANVNVNVHLPDSEQTSPALNFSRFRFPFLGMSTLMICGPLTGL